MPFSLSFFLTLSAVAWFFFGLFSKDIYVAVSVFLSSIRCHFYVPFCNIQFFTYYKKNDLTDTKRCWIWVWGRSNGALHNLQGLEAEAWQRKRPDGQQEGSRDKPGVGVSKDWRMGRVCYISLGS